LNEGANWSGWVDSILQAAISARFRSSPALSAHSHANFGIKETVATLGF
jgi:hypothetical protein